MTKVEFNKLLNDIVKERKHQQAEELAAYGKKMGAILTAERVAVRELTDRFEAEGGGKNG